MYCPHCGAENEKARPLCYRCGTSLRDLEPVRTGRSRFTTGLLLLLAVGVGVIAVGFALLFALTPDPQPLPTLTPTLLARMESTPTATPRPSPTDTPVLPAGVMGRVVDHRSGQPVTGARVMIGDRGTVTDEQGGYTFSGLTPGHYVVAVAQAGYDPALSAVMAVGGGESRNVDIVLYPEGGFTEPVEPLQTNPVAPDGAPTVDDAERLARAQGLVGQAAAVEEATLRGKYWVNYKVGESLYAAVVPLDHEGWALSDERGQVWRIVKTCGSLAAPAPPGWVRPKPVADAVPEPVLPTVTPALGRDLIWSEPVKVSNNVSGSYWPSMVVDSQNRLHAVWEDWAAADGEIGVHYAMWDGTSWTPQTDIPGSEYGFTPDMAVDGNDHLHVVWNRTPVIEGPPVNEIYYSRFDGTLWSEPTMLSEIAGQNLLPKIAVDHEGRIHVIWIQVREQGYETISDVMYTTWSPAHGWASPKSLAHDQSLSSLASISVSGLTPTLVTDRDGNIYLLWVEKSKDYQHSYGKYAGLEGDTWLEPTTIFEATTWFADASLAFDSKGLTHVVWVYTESSRRSSPFYYRIRQASETWSEPQVICEKCMYGPVIAIDGQDRIYVAGSAGRYLWWNGAEWSPVGELMEEGTIPYIVIDHQNQVHVLIWVGAENFPRGDFYHLVGTVE